MRLTFTKGQVLIAGGGAPFKCPPAPSEAALMMHDYLTKRGIRGACEITLILPLEVPIPPSPETSRALLAAFAERNITFVADREMRSVDTQRRGGTLDHGRVVSPQHLLRVPARRAPTRSISVQAAAPVGLGCSDGKWVNPFPLPEHTSLTS